MIFLELSYKFNNDEKSVLIERKEFLNPRSVTFYLKDGDSIYVTNNQQVYVNQLLAVNALGVKMFSPISGFAQIKGNSVIVANDNQGTEISNGESSIQLEKMTKEEILNICNSFGIGSGNKSLFNELKENKKILFVNGLDIEPYLFNSQFVLHENCKNTLDVMTLLYNAFGVIPYIAVSKYDQTDLAQIKSILANYPYVRLLEIKETFPKNELKFILNKYLKEYSDKEILVMDVQTIFKLFVALVDKKPCHKKKVTVLFNNPMRYYLVDTYYGVNLEEMIDSFVPPSWGGKVVYLNNYYRKNKCMNFDYLTVTDNVNTIFVFDEEADIVTKCINCGKCADVCPVKINPLDTKLDSSCIRCGLCNYVCPANINLIVRVKDHG